MTSDDLVGASRLPSVGTTIFTVMSALAARTGAINLGQGFPDFDCDPALVDAVDAAMRAGHNQYPPMTGVPALRQAVADKIALTTGHRYDADAEITVEWERDIGAIGLTCQKHGEPRTFVRYVWDQGESKWRKLDGGGEIYEDVTSALVDFLYPEMKPPAV